MKTEKINGWTLRGGELSAYLAGPSSLCFATAEAARDFAKEVHPADFKAYEREQILARITQL